MLEEFTRDREHVNSYVFMDKLSDRLTGGDTIVTGNGLDCVSFWQGFRIRAGQRAILNGNWGSMGWDLPAAVGACIGGGRRRTVCVTGDGSIALNVQELMTIRRHDLPIKVFLFNNRGYTSIRMTQNALFEGRFVGADFPSGLANPDFALLAAAYGLPYLRAADNDAVDAAIGEALALPGPAFCELNISPEQVFAPKASAFRREDGTIESRPLEDMAPFLPREEIRENMHLFDGEPAP
jgi:acetolactate synthase-1/2/3 large subunit